MTKKLVIGILLAFPLLTTAQRSRMQPGRTNQGQGGSFQNGRIAGANPAYHPRVYSNFYGSNYYSSGFYGNYDPGFGPRNGTILGPGFNNGSQANILTLVPELAPPVQAEYIPTYMRPDNGPSLAEIAKSLKTERKPAVLIWSNWESPAKKN